MGEKHLPKSNTYSLQKIKNTYTTRNRKEFSQPLIEYLQKPTPNITPNNERPNASPRWGTRQRYPLSLLLINTGAEKF